MRKQWYGRSSERIRRLNTQIAQHCQARGYVVVDATDILSDASGERAAGYHMGDGLHLSPHGYAA